MHSFIIPVLILCLRPFLAFDVHSDLVDENPKHNVSKTDEKNEDKGYKSFLHVLNARNREEAHYA